jgi:hypothetical protein
MRSNIRLATEEEVKHMLQEGDSNLTPMSRVFAMDDMLVVWRVAHELDPFHFADRNPVKMERFIWGMENILKGAGVTEFFFNTNATDEKWSRWIRKFGGELLSKQPDYRWRINLTDPV